MSCTVVPGAAMSTAFWMECPSGTTMTFPLAADTAPANPALSTSPAAVAETQAVNLRMSPPPCQKLR